MSDDIRAAAERLRRLHNGESMAVVYERPNSVHEDTGLSFVDPESLAENYCDEQRIVGAYLELVPADDNELITLGTFQAITGASGRHADLDDVFGLYLNGRNEVELIAESEKRDSSTYYLNRKFTTVGQLRRLIALLAVNP